MKPLKELINVRPGTTLEDYKVQAQALVNSFGTNEPDFVTKMFSFVTDDAKVLVQDSDESSPIVQDMASWPLARSQANLVEYIYMSFSGTSDAADMGEAINIATGIADKQTLETGKITVVKLADKVNYSRTRTVLPTMFANSKYVQRISSVVVGTAPVINDKTPTAFSNTFKADGTMI